MAFLKIKVDGSKVKPLYILTQSPKPLQFDSDATFYGIINKLEFDSSMLKIIA